MTTILGGTTMQNERKRILAMLENGTITTDEALTLLETLGNAEQAGKTRRSEDIYSPAKKPAADEQTEQEVHR